LTASGELLAHEVFTSGPFKGVDRRDRFALAALAQQPVVAAVGAIAWPAGLAPAAVPLGSYRPGQAITGPLALGFKPDALIVLYTELETRALLEVFTGDNDWSPARARTWCGYGHNFASFKPLIEGISGDSSLEHGLFGYLAAIRIGAKHVLLYKSELHPKQNGPGLPFVPVLKQLIGEMAPGLVLTTGTAGAIGGVLECGDVVITRTARFHCRTAYPKDPKITQLSASGAPLTNEATFDARYVQFAAANLTRLSLGGLSECYRALQKQPGYSFVRENTAPP
jgi:hypothetical protein